MRRKMIFSLQVIAEFSVSGSRPSITSILFSLNTTNYKQFCHVHMVWTIKNMMWNSKKQGVIYHFHYKKRHSIDL